MKIDDFKRQMETPFEPKLRQTAAGSAAYTIADFTNTPAGRMALGTSLIPESVITGMEKSVLSDHSRASRINEITVHQARLAQEQRDNVRITAESAIETLRIAKASAGDSALALELARKSYRWTRIAGYAALVAIPISVAALYYAAKA